MKKIIRGILKWIGILLLAGIVGTVAFRFLYARNWGDDADGLALADVAWEAAEADGVISPEEVAQHYAPVIDQAVNVLLSEGGRGDFITAVDYDGDWSALNNWENLRSGDLGAVVYYSVQETDTHWFVGYYFYHPRDDAEIWLDRHENDLEGVMLAVPKSDDGYLPPEYMYTQGHGNVYFYFSGSADSMLNGSHYGGALALQLNTDRPCIYITPNGTLENCGHSVESAAGHSTYWSVGESGVRYFYGGVAETPVTWNGDFSRNPCSYALRPLEELWAWRNGPYDGTGVFGSYGAFDGDNWGTDKANPPWGWRNKTIYGFGGSFLSDPAWTINHAISGAALSADYTVNPWAEWRISNIRALIPATVDADSVTLHLIREGGWELSNPAWFTLTEERAGVYAVTAGGQNALWVAAPETATWRFEVRGADGQLLTTCAVAFDKAYRAD
ncbi:MAG: hypothetical protein IJE07_08210 [Clostridia bacterium]|nr:hypothetical protein [Clostridia bacterium]